MEYERQEHRILKGLPPFCSLRTFWMWDSFSGPWQLIWRQALCYECLPLQPSGPCFCILICILNSKALKWAWQIATHRFFFSQTSPEKTRPVPARNVFRGLVAPQAKKVHPPNGGSSPGPWRGGRVTLWRYRVVSSPPVLNISPLPGPRDPRRALRPCQYPRRIKGSEIWRQAV